MTAMPFLVFGALLFAIGLYAVLARKNLIGILIGVELMLNACSVNFLAFGRYGAPEATTSQVVVLFIIGLAAAEAAIALSIVLAVYRSRSAIDADQLTELQG
jgi:NADH:ubiquinone oxidoreductase subunit K